MRLDLGVRNTQAVAANFRAFDLTFQGEVREIVRETGEATKGLAFFLAPVDTGFLREHIRDVYGPEGLAFEVGWFEEDFTKAGLAFYPIFTEFGTRFAPAQPCLFPAYEEMRPGFVLDLVDAMRRSAKRSGLS